ncbi:MAG: NGG1p interacting factor NIF3 [Candidatus Accumulibacter sp.]|jgi:hypothetical protein|nr:NGG1p interacting factor NIF3 [Accumulibacter sp.]
MSDIPYRLTVQVPVQHAETLKNALFAAGAGRYDGYDRCCWQVLGDGQFRPLPGAHPAVGAVGEEEHVAEYRIEFVCREADLPAITDALYAAHPYEVPAFDFAAVSRPARTVPRGTDDGKAS